MLILLAILTVSMQLFVTRAQQAQIVIDGDVRDWDALNIQPAYVDDTGDTEAWSKDVAIVGIGATSEPADKVAANDKCRDLKALYVWGDQEWIYIRLDVAELYSGWSTVSVKFAPDEMPVVYSNVSFYHIYFDVASGGQGDSASASDVSFGDYAWEFNLQFDAGWDGTGYTKPYLQFSDWTGVSINDFAVDVSRSAFEMRIQRATIEEKVEQLETANIFVGSAKPGEPYGNWGTWLHTFDPQHPGCPGEASGGQCGPLLDRGSDFADIMPSGTLTPPSDERDPASHFAGPPIVAALTPAPPSDGEAPPVFPILPTGIAIVVIVIVIAIIVYVLWRKK